MHLDPWTLLPVRASSMNKMTYISNYNEHRHIVVIYGSPLDFFCIPCPLLFFFFLVFPDLHQGSQDRVCHKRVEYKALCGKQYL